jgi:hypothetical protein
MLVVEVVQADQV